MNILRENPEASSVPEGSDDLPFAYPRLFGVKSSCLWNSSTSLRLNEALAFLNLTERYGLAELMGLSQLCRFVICQVQRRLEGLTMDEQSRIFRRHPATALIVGALKPSWRCFGDKRILRHFCGRVRLCLEAAIASQAAYIRYFHAITVSTYPAEPT